MYLASKVRSVKSKKELILKVYKIINDYSMYLESSYMKIFNKYTLLQKDCIINNSNLKLLVNFTKL